MAAAVGSEMMSKVHNVKPSIYLNYIRKSMFTNIIVSFSDLVLWYLIIYPAIIIQMHLQLKTKSLKDIHYRELARHGIRIMHCNLQ